MTALVVWQLTHGATAMAYIEALEKRGAPVPSHLRPPEIDRGYWPWFQAFWELSTDRAYQGGPIPNAAIAGFPVACHESEWFRRLIRAMDRAYLEFYTKPAKSEKFRPGMLKGKKRND